MAGMRMMAFRVTRNLTSGMGALDCPQWRSCLCRAPLRILGAFPDQPQFDGGHAPQELIASNIKAAGCA